MFNMSLKVSRDIVYKKQIDRIKKKLKKAKRIDRNCAIFGVSSHEYRLNKKLSKNEVEEFELKYSIKLPEDFKEFLLEIRNGGAGPFYGVLKLQNMLNHILNDPKKFLCKECKVFSNMKDDDWKRILKDYNELNDGVSEAKFEAIKDEIYSGILMIGSFAKESYYGLILNGNYMGKILALDEDFLMPKFIS